MGLYGYLCMLVLGLSLVDSHAWLVPVSTRHGCAARAASTHGTYRSHVGRRISPTWQRHASSSSEESSVDIQVLQRDAWGYAGLSLLQAVPAFCALHSPPSWVQPAFFIGLATMLVNIGARRADIPDSLERPLTWRDALVAPILASAFIFTCYQVIKNTDLDVSTALRYTASVTGAVSIGGVTSSFFGAVFPYLSKPVTLTPPKDGSPGKIFDPRTDVRVILGLLAGIFALFQYNLMATSNDLVVFPVLNNLICSCIALQVIPAVPFKNFQVACLLLMGLFAYDVWWVFGTDVMMTVATRIESPIKFLFPADPEILARRVIPYPYSILGLGDIVIPGLMAALARRLDTGALERAVMETNTVEPEIGTMAKIQSDRQGKFKYLDAATLGYTAGLSMAYTAIQVFNVGQPALLYLSPCLIVSIVLTAIANNELNQVWTTSLSEEKKAPKT